MATDTGFDLDIDSAVQAIGEDLFNAAPIEDQDETTPPEEPSAEPEPGPDPDDAGEDATPEEPLESEEGEASGESEEEAPPDTVEALAVPESWPKDMQAHWANMPREAQEYWQKREDQMYQGLEQYKEGSAYGKSMKDIITPYMPMLNAHGFTEQNAVQTLLNAQYKLTTGTPESRKAAYDELGRELGLVTATTDGTGTQPVDPQVQQLQGRLANLETTLQQRQTQALTDAKAKAQAEVDAYAADPAHPYFDDVSSETAKGPHNIVTYINAGMSLDEAYKAAVAANPVTQAKEQARIQKEHEAQLKETARVNGEKKKKATAANVHSHESTSIGSHEPLGTMDDTIAATLQNIRSRGS